jgi:hypothetical protein
MEDLQQQRFLHQILSHWTRQTLAQPFPISPAFRKSYATSFGLPKLLYSKQNVSKVASTKYS